MDKYLPRTARLSGKRLLWLVLASVILYLVNIAYRGTGLTWSPLSSSTHSAILEDKMTYNVKTDTPLDKHTAETSNKQQNGSGVVTTTGPGKHPSVRKTAAGRSRTSELDKLTAAAARIRAVFLPPTFPFSNDVYFHPPESGPARNLSHFLISPVPPCSAEARPSKDSPFLVVLVLSSYLEQAAREREAIRASYGSVTRGLRWPRGKPLVAPVRMLFLLGTPPTARDRQAVQAESGQHGDLLVAGFLDSYHNLTLKVLHGLHWVLHHCPQTKFILKADDDVFVNLPLLTTFLFKHGRPNSIYGHGYFGSKVSRVGRWAVPKAEYPVPRYPVYMSGTAYAMSTDAAKKIVGASHRLPLVVVEDAFITGILVQITGARRLTCTGFTHFAEGRPDVCDFVNDHRMVGNRMHAAEKMGLWAKLKNDYLLQNCVD